MQRESMHCRGPRYDGFEDDHCWGRIGLTFAATLKTRADPLMHHEVFPVVFFMSMGRMTVGEIARPVHQLFQKKEGRQSQRLRGRRLSPLVVRISPGPPKTRQATDGRRVLRTRTPSPDRGWCQSLELSSIVLEPFSG